MSGCLSPAVVQTAFGGPWVLEPKMVDVRAPGSGEVRIQHSAIGVNFHDIYVRTGLYQTLALPGIPGIEAVGEIIEVGPDVVDWRVGQRVAYIDRTYGAYCEKRVIDETLLVEPPTSMSDGVVATSLVRGLTAIMLLEEVYRVRQGDLCLIHAVGGSTGRLLAAWARHIGARVVGTAGKRTVPADITERCENVYSYADTDWSERVLADYGARFDYVCDSVGAPTFDGSLKVTAPCGHIALFGQSGGKVDQVAIQSLAAKSLTVTRPILFDYIASTAKRASMICSFRAMIDAGVLDFPEPIRLPLDQAGKAQAMLEERSVNGPVVLVP